MIIAIERASYITIQRARFTPKLSVVQIGKLREISDVWSVLFEGRNLQHYSDLLNGSEKRQIIGLLDKLNQTDYRAQEDMRRYWNKIISDAVEAWDVSDEQYRKMMQLGDTQ